MGPRPEKEAQGDEEQAAKTDSIVQLSTEVGTYTTLVGRSRWRSLAERDPGVGRVGRGFARSRPPARPNSTRSRPDLGDFDRSCPMSASIGLHSKMSQTPWPSFKHAS